MQKPLGAGDICIVINGLAGPKSPNVGKLVTIDKRIYGDFGLDHRLYGPMYTCIGKDLVKFDDMGQYITTSVADFPGIWLRRIDPPKLTKELEKITEVESNEPV